MIRADSVVEDNWLFAESGYFWINWRSRGMGGREEILVINLQKKIVERRIHLEYMPIFFNSGKDKRLMDHGVLADTGRVFSGSGRQITSFPKKTPGHIIGTTIHPDGDHYVLLIHDEDSQDDDSAFENDIEENFYLTLEVVPADSGKSEVLVISDADGDRGYAIATSKRDKLIFVYYCLISGESINFKLAAYHADHGVLRELYKVAAPADLTFAIDQFSDRVATISLANNGFNSIILTRNVPEFNLSAPEIKNLLSDIPTINNYFDCDAPTRAANATLMTYIPLLENTSTPDARQMFKEMTTKVDVDPDNIASFQLAMSQPRFSPLVMEVKEYLQLNFPKHSRVLLDIAQKELQQQNWQKVVDLFQDMRLEEVTDGTEGHICHLLGIGFFGIGNIDKAMEIWQKGQDFERCRCNLRSLLIYGRYATMNGQEREQAYQQGDFPESLYVIEKIDEHLARKEWRAIISTMEKYSPDKINNNQIAGRLAEAWLHIDIDAKDEALRLVKNIVLTDIYANSSQDYHVFDFIPLPPYLTTWSEKRLTEVFTRVMAWLKGTLNSDFP